MDSKDMNSKDNEDLDQRLLAAYAEDPLDASAVQQKVRKRISAERLARRMLIGAVAAVALAIAGYGLLDRARETNVYAELARDHRLEVIEQKQHHWRSESSEIQSLVARYGVTVPMLAGFAPAGYHLKHAKSCGVAGMPVLHLVYANGDREMSVYVRQHVGSGIRPGSFTVGSEQVAAFQRGGFEGAVVMVGSGNECQVMARHAASFL